MPFHYRGQVRDLSTLGIDETVATDFEFPSFPKVPLWERISLSLLQVC